MPSPLSRSAVLSRSASSPSSPALGAAPAAPPALWVERLDLLGILLSAACIVHCAAMPLLLVMVPLLGDHAFEEGARTVLGGVGVLGIGWGTVQHRNLRAVAPLLLALGLFSWMAWEQPRGRLELLLSMAASFALMIAHALNTWACSGAKTSSAHSHLPGDGVWVPERRPLRALPLMLALSVGLHAGVLGWAMQSQPGAAPGGAAAAHDDAH